MKENIILVIVLVIATMIGGCSTTDRTVASDNYATTAIGSNLSYIIIGGKQYRMCNSGSFEGDTNEEPQPMDNAFDLLYGEDIVFSYCDFSN